MIRQLLIATVTVFIAWTALDFLIHGVLLEASYQETAHLWRPVEDMDMLLMHVVTLAYVTCFVSLYAFFCKRHDPLSGIYFGAMFGLAAGISMGFGSWIYMPIPLTLALTWFGGTLLECITAGAIAAAIIKD